MKKHLTLNCWLFYLTVIALVMVCVGTRAFLNSASTDIVYASQPGEQLEAITATPTATPTPGQGSRKAVVTSTPTPTLSPTVTLMPSFATGAAAVTGGAAGESNEMTVKRQICDVFKSDCDRAIEVAKAESNFNPNAKNGHSTATGIFQIVIGTWKGNHCEGERTNALDNAKCAHKIYLASGKRFSTSNGWEASYHLHHQD